MAATLTVEQEQVSKSVRVPISSRLEISGERNLSAGRKDPREETNAGARARAKIFRVFPACGPPRERSLFHVFNRDNGGNDARCEMRDACDTFTTCCSTDDRTNFSYRSRSSRLIVCSRAKIVAIDSAALRAYLRARKNVNIYSRVSSRALSSRALFLRERDSDRKHATEIVISFRNVLNVAIRISAYR